MKSFIAKAAFLGAIALTPFLASAQWAAPTATPPSNNASTPLNVSSTGQTKVGGLTVNTGGAATGFVVSSGSVGIGTTTPAQTFSVSTAASDGGMMLAGVNSPKIIVNDTNSGYPGMIFSQSNVPKGRFELRPEGEFSFKTDAGSGYFIAFRPNDNISLVLGTNGYVGVGNNTTPGALLTVGDNIGITGAKSMSLGNSTGNTYHYIGQDATHNISTSWLYNASPSAAFGQIQTFGRSNPLYVDGSELYLNAQSSAGNVGIGTTLPTTKLHVAGTGYVQVDPNDGRLEVASGNDGLSYIDFKGSGNLASDWRGRLAYDDGSGWKMYAGANGTAVMGITEGGNMGIGTLVPGYKLEVTGSVGAVSYFYTSDRSLKDDIAPLSGSLEKVLKLQGVSFSWKESGKKSVGLIAQDVEKVFPELVSTGKETGLKAVEYGNLVAPLIEAVKEQQRQIDALKAEVESLKSNR
jgi:hypothetical protein